MRAGTEVPVEWQLILSKEAVSAEKQGALTARQLELVNRAGWFRIFLPASMGGLGLALPDALRLEESLARIDGSLGWTVTLCSGATMFAGYLKPQLAEELLASSEACFGGSGAPDGTADMRGDHYIVSGRWKYATGAPHLTVFTANCRMMSDGVPMRDQHGQQVVRAFVFKRNEVTIHEDWHTMGLCATAGHTFSIDSLRVPVDRVFDIMPDMATLPDLIFRYPFLPFAELTLAINTSGMIGHFLDCCEEIFAGKARKMEESNVAFYSELLAESRIRWEELRGSVHTAAGNSWQELAAEGTCRQSTLDTVHAACVGLVRDGRRIVVNLMPYCGMAAIHSDSAINRVWRDIFTASQHSLLNRLQ